MKSETKVWLGHILVGIGETLQQTGRDSMEQREWYQYRSLPGKIIWFTFDTVFLYLFYNFSFWLVHLQRSAFTFIGFAIVWYISAVIRLWYRKMRSKTKQTAIGT